MTTKGKMEQANRQRARPPTWVTDVLDSLRIDALFVGIDEAQAESTIGWIDGLASGVRTLSGTRRLSEEWVMHDDPRTTLWAVAAQTYRSASDALAVVVEFANNAGDTTLSWQAACDLRETAAVLHSTNPLEARIIGEWLDRQGTIATPAHHVDLARPCHASRCWIDGTQVARTEIDSAIVAAGISNTPLVVEFGRGFRRSAISVLHLADETCATSDAWCRDLSSGLTGWFSRFGGWTPTD